MLKGHKQWVTEVNVLGQIEHPNLVKLIGYCAEDDGDQTHRILVYEYMPNGSLADWLSSESITPLSWPMRLKVARDAARALTYLHQQMPSPVSLFDQYDIVMSCVFFCFVHGVVTIMIFFLAL